MLGNLLTISLALAQDPPPPSAPDDGSPEAADRAPESTVVRTDDPDRDLPLSYASGWAWSKTGLGVENVVDIAISPQQDLRWAVVTGDRAVFVTDDGGSSWREVLASVGGALSQDERLLVEVEARIRELTDESASVDGDDFLDEEELLELEAQADEAQDLAREAADQLQSELEGDRWFLDGQDPQGFESERALRSRVVFASDGALWVARTDGVLRSVDFLAWEQVYDETVSSLAAEPYGTGTVLAGTRQGVFRLRAAGIAPVPMVALQGVRVNDVVVDNGLFVATDAGIYATAPTDDTVPATLLPVAAEGALTVRPTTPGPVVSAESLPEPGPGDPPGIQPDGERVRPLVYALPETLWYGARPTEGGGAPVPGRAVPMVRDLARRDVAMMLAASEAGPFESTDGGVTWVPLPRGLDEAPARAVEVRGEVVLLAGPGGLYQLRPAPPELEEERDSLLAPFVPLPLLMDATLRRPELTQKLGSRWVAAALPQVSLSWQYRQQERLHWDADTWTTSDTDTYWVALLRLTWRPNRQPAAGSLDFSPDDTVTAFVVDNDVVIDDGTSPNVLFAKVNRGNVRYRDELAQTITTLYRERQRLAQERVLLREAPLIQRLDRTLRMAEVEARLDALTDSMVSRWASAQLDP